MCSVLTWRWQLIPVGVSWAPCQLCECVCESEWERESSARGQPLLQTSAHWRFRANHLSLFLSNCSFSYSQLLPTPFTSYSSSSVLCFTFPESLSVPILSLSSSSKSHSVYIHSPDPSISASVHLLVSSCKPTIIVNLLAFISFSFTQYAAYFRRRLFYWRIFSYPVAQVDIIKFLIFQVFRLSIMGYRPPQNNLFLFLCVRHLFERNIWINDTSLLSPFKYFLRCPCYGWIKWSNNCHFLVNKAKQCTEDIASIGHCIVKSQAQMLTEFM